MVKFFHHIHRWYRQRKKAAFLCSRMDNSFRCSKTSLCRPCSAFLPYCSSSNTHNNNSNSSNNFPTAQEAFARTYQCNKCTIRWEALLRQKSTQYILQCSHLWITNPLLKTSKRPPLKWCHQVRWWERFSLRHQLRKKLLKHKLSKNTKRNLSQNSVQKSKCSHSSKVLINKPLRISKANPHWNFL